MDTISFFYNPYIYFESYKNVLFNLRKHYPSEDVFIYFDDTRPNLNKYVEVANENNCIANIRDNSFFYIDRKDSPGINIPKQVEFLNRLINICSNTESKWILILEDDVLIKRPIINFPHSDCGKNREDIGFLGGGSIFKRETFLKIFETHNEDSILKLIESNRDACWAGDVLLKLLFSSIGARSQKWVELAEPNYFDDTDHAIYHGYKDLHHLG
jgi:hypothetical protein